MLTNFSPLASCSLLLIEYRDKLENGLVSRKELSTFGRFHLSILLKMRKHTVERTPRMWLDNITVC